MAYAVTLSMSHMTFLMESVLRAKLCSFSSQQPPVIHCLNKICDLMKPFYEQCIFPSFHN